MIKEIKNTEHDYYCSERNYFSGDCQGEFETFKDFIYRIS